MPLWRRTASEQSTTRSRVPLSRRFTYRYVLAIALACLMGVVAYRSATGSIETIDTKTRQLEAASSQAARIYRITGIAQRLDEESSRFNETSAVPEFVGDANRVEGLASSLKQEINLLTQTQAGLLNGDVGLGLPAPELNTKLRDVYYDTDRLEQRVQEVANTADSIVALKAPLSTNRAPRSQQLDYLRTIQDDTVRAMEKAVDIYRDDVESVLSAQEDVNALLLFSGLAMAVGMAFLLFRPMAQKIRYETTQLEEAEKISRENNERQSFRTALAQGLEVESEEEVFATVGRALQNVIPDNPAELLLADASETHLRRVQVHPDHGEAGCPVDTPKGCAAVRRGATQVYESSRMLNVCPKLPQHSGGACSAVCVPVVFSGHALGVLHVIGKDNQPPDHTQIERLTVLASETGNRTGTLQVTRMTQQHATTDGLTGLFNRRTLEEKASDLRKNEQPFSVALADLDHFKDLNDTYGHEAGDKALRLFASVMAENLRPDDIPARYGGEEFVVLLPDTDIHDALAALERLQVALAAEIERSGSMPFTASWGLTDHTAGTTFDEMVAVADAALYSAKRAGRNCIMVDGEAAGGSMPEEAPAEGTGDEAPLMEIDMDLLQQEAPDPQT